VADPREKELPGLTPWCNYGLEPGLRITEAAAQSWERAKTYWAAFQARLRGSRPGAELGITRQMWLVPLLASLATKTWTIASNRRNTVGEASHLAPCNLGRKRRAAAARGCKPAPGQDRPHRRGHEGEPARLLQSYLNETDHLWGIVSNGRQLRILRDNASLTRPAYLEFDLEE